MDHLHPFKLILFRIFFRLLTVIPQNPFSYYPRKIGKWKSHNLSETQCLGHSNWTICILLSNFALIFFKLLTFIPQSPFPYYPRKMRKWNSLNLSEIQCLGHLNWTICTLLSQFCSDIFQTFDFYTPEPISLLPQETEKMKLSQPE